MQQSGINGWRPRTALGPMFVRVVTLAVLTFVVGSTVARSADGDLQLWFPVQFIHPVGETWSVSLQTELRLKEDITEFSELVYKPALNYHVNTTWALSVGYKYIDKYRKSNEQDFWQESHFNTKFGDLVAGFQVRLEERFIDDIDGVIPRLRLLQHVSHPIGDSPCYLTGFCAIRFYRDGEGKWRSSDLFNRDDLLLVGKVSDLCHSWVCQAVQNGSPSPAAPEAEVDTF